MENNKLKVKDLVNIGIFSALYMAIAMVVMLPVGITPVLWLLWPGIAGLFGGAFFTLLLAKVPKMGSALLLAIISGILFFATGECTWVIIVTFAVAGILGEIARKIFGYKSFKGIALPGCGKHTKNWSTPNGRCYPKGVAFALNAIVCFIWIMMIWTNTASRKRNRSSR